MSAKIHSHEQDKSTQEFTHFLQFYYNKRINYAYFKRDFVMRHLKETFDSKHDGGFTRRGALGVLLGGAALAALPGGNEAEAAGRTPVEMMHEMQDYSEDPNHRGVGIFINLQRGTTIEQGEQLGERLKSAFAGRGVPVEYRINQSKGTATDLTFYVRGYDFTINVADLRGQLGNVLAHHRDVWAPGQATLSSLDQ